MQSFFNCIYIVLCCSILLPNGYMARTKGKVLVSPMDRLQLPHTAVGPEALAFDPQVRGPYISVSDGRILRYNTSSASFDHFAFIAPNRPQNICDGSVNPIFEPLCGRPLGLGFNKATGDLFIVDAYLGLAIVGPAGGYATIVATEADGVPFRFLNGLDIDQASQVVYFTDTSAKFARRGFMLVDLTGDKTGRLLSYDIRSKQLRVLLKGLAGPNGVALSKNGDYLIFSEMVTRKLQRFWIKGPKANTLELFAPVRGSPDNVKRTPRGDEFWVASSSIALASTIPAPIGWRFNEQGNVTKKMKFNPGVLIPILSEVHEFKGQLFLGFLNQRFVGVVPLPN